jgi:glycosyltransferase 2 family protein
VQRRRQLPSANVCFDIQSRLARDFAANAQRVLQASMPSGSEPVADESVAPKRPTRSLRTWIFLLVFVVLAVTAFSMVGDIRGVIHSVSGFHWWTFAAAIVLAMTNYVLRFFRWQLYLQDQGVKVPSSSSAIVFGAGLSLAVTPGKLGELVKCYLLQEMHDVPIPLTAPVVLAERVSDLVALLAIAVIGVAWYGIAASLVVAATILIAAGFVLLAWPRPTRWLINLATSPRFLRRLREPLHSIYNGVAHLCRPKLLMVSSVIAIPAWLCECVGFWLIIRGFPESPAVALGLATIIYAGTTIAGALSFLPGGLGVTEASMTYLLVRGASALSNETALAATLLTRLATLWFAVVIGLVFLAWAKARIARGAATSTSH